MEPKQAKLNESKEVKKETPQKPEQDTNHSQTPEDSSKSSQASASKPSTPKKDEPVKKAPKKSEKSPKEVQAEFEQKLLYLRAEFDNYKKRLLRDQEKVIQSANEKIIRDLLPILDHFDRALSSSKSLKEESQKKCSGIKDFITGIEMTHRELINVLKRFGVELIGVQGEMFDPERHEAISQLEAPTEKANTIINIIHQGCLLNGRLLEPAKVVVAKGSEEA